MTEQIFYHVALDLGQMNDFSAVAVIEKRIVVDGHNRALSEPTMNCLTLKRYELRTPYPEIVRDVSARLEAPPFVGGTFVPHRYPVSLTLDATGVGVPISDLFRADKFLQRRVQLKSVMITGGTDESYSEGFYRVPKRNLVAAAQVALQTQKLKIAKRAQDAAALKDELQNFQVKFTDSGNDTYNARSGANDDLILAVCLAVWSANKPEMSEGNDALRRALGGGRTGGGRQNRHLSR